MWRLLNVCVIITLAMMCDWGEEIPKTEEQIPKTEEQISEVEKEMPEIEEQIMRHEGFRSNPFTGPQGALLIGYGRNLKTRGITEEEALFLLKNDIKNCENDLFKIFAVKWFELTSARRHALIDMHYTLGPTGFRKFKKMIAAVKNGDYTLAAVEMLYSEWYDQVGERGRTLYLMMLNGDKK